MRITQPVIISRGKGDDNSPSSYRPPCMLVTANKLFEKLIKRSLHAAVEAAGAQWGKNATYFSKIHRELKFDRKSKFLIGKSS